MIGKYPADNMGPSKLEKAQKLGIAMVSEEEFLEMIKWLFSMYNLKIIWFLSLKKKIFVLLWAIE